MNRQQTASKEYLMKAYRMDMRISSKLRQVDSLNDLAVRATATISDMPGNPSKDPHKMENIIVMIVDLQQEIGKDIEDLLSMNNVDISANHMDCGIEIFDNEEQDTHSGGSGCGCSATVLAGYILKKVSSGEWKRVLFVPTGALLSTVSYNEGQTIPGIAHAVMIEHHEKKGE